MDFLEWLRTHAALLHQITQSVSKGVTPPGFDRVLAAAQSTGKDLGDGLQKIGANVGKMPRAQDYKNRDDYAKAFADYSQRFAVAHANLAAQLGTPEAREAFGKDGKLTPEYVADLNSPAGQDRRAASMVVSDPKTGKLSIPGVWPQEVPPHEPNSHLAVVAKKYVADNNIDTRALPRVAKVDPEKGKMMADAYAALKSDPNDPAVREAYAQFGKEVQAQHDALIKAGYNFDYSPHDPYPNSAAMLKDLRDNKTIKVFKTAEGQEHPLLSNDQNDMFRAVHDALGHGINGNQFGPKGEEHAFRDHSAMFSPLARRVMATETRGQNSWVNFGPHSDLPMKDRPFAEQKAALWPEHLMGDYSEMTPPAPKVVLDDAGKPRVFYHGTQNDFDKFEIGREGKNSTVFGSYPVKRHAAFFAEDPELAREFADQGGRTGTIKKVNLSIHNPIDLTKDISDEDYKRLQEIGYNPRFIDNRAKHTMYEIFDEDAGGGKPTVDALKKLGYDGAKLSDISSGDVKNTTSWAAFDADQIHPHVEPQQENWLHPHISVEEPSIIRKVEPIARAGAIPEQHDIPRLIGKKQSNIDNVEDLAYQTYMGPHFRQWLQQGRDLPGGPNWYDTRETKQKAIDALGDVEGPKAFRDMLNFMGASTARSNPSNNLRRASWWRALNMAGLLDPEELRSTTLPSPPGMGHIAQRLHHVTVADLVENGGLNSIKNPKPAGFVENLDMNGRPFTNDTRMATAAMKADPRMTLGVANTSGGGTPRDWAYAPMERAFQRAAGEYHQQGLLADVPAGVDPTSTAQAQIWGGIDNGTSHAGSFNDIFNKLLSRSANLWGVSPDVANRHLWQGNPFDLPLNSPLLKR